MERPAKTDFRDAVSRSANAATQTPWEQVPWEMRNPPRDPVGGERPGSGAALTFGLERRLPRRAETMWEQLATPPGLPPAAAVAPFLRPPYAGNAMLLRRPMGQPARIETIGEGLQAITHLRRGEYQPDEGGMTALGRQMVELCEQALAAATPQRLESERMSQRPSAGRPHLLLRAVALPFAPDERGESAGVVIASWRKLLSAEETAALHRELAAAMDWMHRQRPRE